MKYLFLFTLGPVQGFIAQARKAHDLHSGSRLLSELCKVAAKTFISNGGSLIFPDISSDSIPNRFLGKLEKEQIELKRIGSAVEGSVRKEWENKFNDNLGGMLDGPTLVFANKQLQNHLDIHWLFHLVEDNTDETYRSAYEEINIRLNALKNTRPFNDTEEAGRKCNLDGERNVIFYRKSKTQIQKSDEDLRSGSPLFASENLIKDYADIKTGLQLRHIQPGEGLSAVSMLKRFQDFKAAEFPSTAEFAIADSVESIGRKQRDEMTYLFNHSHPRFLNWQVFFEDNLNERYFEKQGLELSKLSEATKIQNDLQQAASKAGRKLDKYYGLVVFDGDNMGDWWNGSHLKGTVNLEVFHGELTRRLAEFADTVRKEFDKDQHRGWVIYAGGDDFLGFFNLHHLMDSLIFLNDQYKKIVSDPLMEYIDSGQALTFSAGVCIAHYKEPLSLILGKAREFEHRAKGFRDEKNAFAIGVIPGSGEIATSDLPSELLLTFGKIIEALKGGTFSSTFITKSRAELPLFVDRDKKLSSEIKDVVLTLLDRGIERAFNSDALDGMASNKEFVSIQEMQTMVKDLMGNCKTISGFLDALDIADFIKRQTYISQEIQMQADS